MRLLIDKELREVGGEAGGRREGLLARTEIIIRE